MRIALIGGPRDGQVLSLPDHKLPPTRLKLPVWPEPDVHGPPYSIAVYERSPASGIDYRYLHTEDS